MTIEGKGYTMEDFTNMMMRSDKGKKGVKIVGDHIVDKARLEELLANEQPPQNIKSINDTLIECGFQEVEPGLWSQKGELKR